MPFSDKSVPPGNDKSQHDSDSKQIYTRKNNILYIYVRSIRRKKNARQFLSREVNHLRPRCKRKTPWRSENILNDLSHSRTRPVWCYDQDMAGHHHHHHHHSLKTRTSSGLPKSGQCTSGFCTCVAKIATQAPPSPENFATRASHSHRSNHHTMFCTGAPPRAECRTTNVACKTWSYLRDHVRMCCCNPGNRRIWQRPFLNKICSTDRQSTLL